MQRILPVLESSFRPWATRRSTPAWCRSTRPRAGLLAGLEVKAPKLSRSGFYVDAKGTVVTTIEAVAKCGNTTIARHRSQGALGCRDRPGRAAPAGACRPIRVVAFPGVPRRQAR